MKKKDLILILGILIPALILLVVGLAARTGGPAAGEIAADPVPLSEYLEAVQSAVLAFFDEYPADSYLLVTSSGGITAPIPLNDDNAFTVRQADGSVNTVHIGKDSFYMEYSNCDNQNCVEQGEVTLENRDTRLLFNLVICLPHNLSLEMLTRDEAQAVLLDLYAQQEAAAAVGTSAP